MNQDAIFYQGFITKKDVPQMFVSISDLVDPDNDATFDDILPFEIYDGFIVSKVSWSDFSGEVELNTPQIAYTYWNIQYSYEIISQEIIKNNNQPRSNTPTNFYRRQSSEKQKQLPQQPLQAIKPQQQLKLPPLANNIKRSNSRGRVLQQDPYVQMPRLPSVQSARSISQQKNFDFKTEVKIKVSVSTRISEKSWVRHQSNLLLDHERGHYLLGCLCALEFKRQAELKTWNDRDENLKIQVAALFKKLLNQFLQIEIKYDEESEHYQHQKMQQKWNRKMKEQFFLYADYFKWL